MGNVLPTENTNGGENCHAAERNREWYLKMKQWEGLVPYLPRVKSTKKRKSVGSKPRSHLHIQPLGDVNSRPKAWRRSDYFYPEMIPEPDYSDTEDEERENEGSGDELNAEVEEQEIGSQVISHGSATSHSSSIESISHSSGSNAEFTDEGLVKPRKPSNPYLQSTERQKLHKELLFNQKYGKGLVGQKSELQQAMDKYKAHKLKKDMLSKQTSLEKILEQQAKKLQMQENGNFERPQWMDRLQQQQQQDTRVDPKNDEFYRVHARVVTHGGYSSAGSDSSISASSTSSKASLEKGTDDSSS